MKHLMLRHWTLLSHFSHWNNVFSDQTLGSDTLPTSLNWRILFLRHGLLDLFKAIEILKLVQVRKILGVDLDKLMISPLNFTFN